MTRNCPRTNLRGPICIANKTLCNFYVSLEARTRQTQVLVALRELVAQEGNKYVKYERMKRMYSNILCSYSVLQ